MEAEPEAKENERIGVTQALSEKIASKCGELSFGSSNISGHLQRVLQANDALRAERNVLHQTFDALEVNQRAVTDAADEATKLSQNANNSLSRSIGFVDDALGEISMLVALVEELSQHIVGFGAAMRQVETSTRQISEIAETTSILALNATIEAAHSGANGKAFGVVASEVKALAFDTKNATTEIEKTVKKLGQEAGDVIQKIQTGARTSEMAGHSIGQIRSSVAEVTQLFGDVSHTHSQVTNAIVMISDEVTKARGVVDGFDTTARKNDALITEAIDLAQGGEIVASELFDSTVKADLSQSDSKMVEMAIRNMERIREVTEEAILSGSLDLNDIFDTDYKAIENSDPQRYRTRLTRWADANWRPLLDEMKAADAAVTAVVCSDINGFLPTHRTERSLQPTGDRTHDDAFCRNGRIVIGPMTRAAKASDAPYQMAVYRHVGDGKDYRVVRNVYVPLTINGRRWGDVELAYSF